MQMRKLYLLLIGVVLFASQAFAQRTVTGKVTDEKGNPMANASVVVRGTTTGTTTKDDGSYTLTVPANARALVFSSVDMSPVEKAIGTATVINATLKAEDKTMSEVIVVGYGTQRRKDVTGNMTSVKGTAVSDKPVQSFEQALGGRAAGVQITIPNGALNNPPVFRIRGTNSISLSSYPLIIIDGVPAFTGDISTQVSSAANALASINPSDIESIDIAKDAASAAIYGSRAANGVVFITTKKGKVGKAKVTYDGWVGFTQAQRLPELLNAQEYTNFKNQALINANLYNATTNAFALTMDKFGNPIDTRWYDYVYRTGFSHSNTLSVSGANEATSYYFSVGYTNQEGIIKKNDFNRKSVLFNVDHKAGRIFSAGAKIAYANEENLAATSSGSLPGEAFATAGLGRAAIVIAPNVAPYNNDGTYNINSTNPSLIGIMGNLLNGTTVAKQVGFYNPVISLDRNRSNSEINHIQASTYVQLKPFNWLAYKVLFGIDYIYANNAIFLDPISGEGYGTTGFAQSSHNYLKRSVLTQTVSFDRVLAKSHTVGIVFGTEAQKSNTESFGLARQTLSDPYFTNIQGGYTTNNPVALAIGQNYLYSVFGRFSYDYAKRYFISANVRKDEYSGLGFNNRKGNFWGVSGGWEASRENFWSAANFDKIFSSFRLRASYGKVGNIGGIGNYESYSTYGSGLYGGVATLLYNNAGNPNLKWETSTKTDVGITFGIMRDRITGEISFFRNNIDGLILDVPQAPSAGLPPTGFPNTFIRQNVGSMYNKGFEFTLGATPINNKKFSWNSSFNIAFNKNRVTKLAPGLNSVIITSPAGAATNEAVSISLPGYSIGMIYVIPTAGVDPATGRRIFINQAGRKVMYRHVPFSWQYEDGTTATPVTALDRRVYRNAVPKAFGGFDNTFRIGDFEVNALITYQFGFYIYYGTQAGLRDQRFWNNDKSVLRAWTKPGDVTDIPRSIFGDNVSNGSGLPLDVNVFKGDFAKLKSVSVAYNLPRSIVDKTKMSSIRLYVSGQNLVIWTEYPGPDPETSTNGNNPGNPGIDRNQVVNGRVITFGLKVVF
jgi:TonB-dependent starch-binding outer membrane protein SusC